MKKLVPFIFLVFGISCKQLCGLDENMEALITKANADFKETMEVENIPCETYTINVILKSDVVDTAAIVKVHTILFDRKQNIGWRRVDVFGPGYKYKFTHPIEGPSYVRGGD